MAEESFADIGRIEAIRRLFEGTPYKSSGKNIFETSGQASVCSFSRMFLEGIDFNLVYFPLKHLGYKCVTAVTGDVYASFFHPRVLSVRIGLSAKLDFEQTKELWGGMVSAASEHGYSDVSLDLMPSRNGLSISVSASGEQSLLQGKRRPRPKSKDLICLSGNVGGAFFGMQLLRLAEKTFEQDGTQPDLGKYKMLVGAYLKPEISPYTVSNMEKDEYVPSAGYLVDRGLSDALKRLSRDTGLGAKIYTDRIPFEGQSFEIAKKLGIDPVSAAMNGGEDYRLLFTIPILKAESFRRDFQTFDIIGHLAMPDAGTVLVTPDGAELPLKAQGWPEEEQ